MLGSGRGLFLQVEKQGHARGQGWWRGRGGGSPGTWEGRGRSVGRTGAEKKKVGGGVEGPWARSLVPLRGQAGAGGLGLQA